MVVKKYIIDYDNNKVCECEVLSEGNDEYGNYFKCLINGEVIERSSVYESIEAANKALDEYIQNEIASQTYAEGYCYACGYYD